MAWLKELAREVSAEALERVARGCEARIGDPAIRYADVLAAQARVLARARRLTVIAREWLPAIVLTGKGYTNNIREQAGRQPNDEFVELRARRAKILQGMMRFGILDVAAVIGPNLPYRPVHDDYRATLAANQELARLAEASSEGGCFSPYLVRPEAEPRLPEVLRGVGAATIVETTDHETIEYRELARPAPDATDVFKEVTESGEKTHFIEAAQLLVPGDGALFEHPLVFSRGETIDRLRAALAGA